jgi:hypothetical protein
VEGIVRCEVDPADLDRLDRFEADCYERITAKALTPQGDPIEVELYQLSAGQRRMVRNEEWDPDRFAKNGLAQFLAGYRGFE